MSKIFDFFDMALCINLDHRPDMWELAQKEFTSVGVDVERFSALKGLHETMPGKGLGKHGLNRSTGACIQMAKDAGAETLLLFEDDVEFIQSREVVDKVLADLKTVAFWDLFYLGGCMRHTNILEKVSEHLVQVKKRGLVTTHAYAIHSRNFDQILGAVENMNIIDAYLQDPRPGGWMNTPRDKVVLHANPLLCVQRDSFSDIANRMQVVPIEKRFNQYMKASKILIAK